MFYFNIKNNPISKGYFSWLILSNKFRTFAWRKKDWFIKIKSL